MRQRLRDAGLCDVCQVFGATAWRRRFQMEVLPLEGEFDITEGMFPSGRIHPKSNNSYRVGGWMLRGGYFGLLQLTFRGDENILWRDILPTLRFIEQWGALEPKASVGYGVILIEEIKLNGQPIQNCEISCPHSLVGRWWNKEITETGKLYYGILPALTNMFFCKVRFEPNDENWWQNIREIKWLGQTEIPEGEAVWLGEVDDQPSGPYGIQNMFPFSRLEHWFNCHKTVPVSFSLRNFLRYDQDGSVCNGDGERAWCKFVLGTIRGCAPICGYCGNQVRKDKHKQQNYWCSQGHVSLSPNQILVNSQRLQSKLHISWAYKDLQQKAWELRIWGWLPLHKDNEKHIDLRKEFLQRLKSILGINSQQRLWHLAQNDKLWQCLNINNVQVCWFEKQDDESIRDLSNRFT